jgi:hypothetical protein
MSTSTTRLDFTSRCNVDAPRPLTSTTRFNFSLCRNVRAQQQRVRLLQLREKARRPAGDHFNFVRMIGGPPTTTSTTHLD